jgi:hypothetical protein
MAILATIGRERIIKKLDMTSINLHLIHGANFAQVARFVSGIDN